MSSAEIRVRSNIFRRRLQSRLVLSLIRVKVGYPRAGDIISNFVVGCRPRTPFIGGVLLP